MNFSFNGDLFKFGTTNIYLVDVFLFEIRFLFVLFYLNNYVP